MCCRPSDGGSGPGEYDAKGTTAGPAFSMAGRTKGVKSKDVVPGPGAYYSETVR